LEKKMARRTQEQWRQLIEEQQASGLNATTFCRDRQINPKYFSFRKQQLKRVAQPGFIRATREPTQSRALTQPSLHYKGIELTLDNCSVEWVAKLIQQLAA
jgi:hypothetical protein